MINYWLRKEALENRKQVFLPYLLTPTFPNVLVLLNSGRMQERSFLWSGCRIQSSQNLPCKYRQYWNLHQNYCQHWQIWILSILKPAVQKNWTPPAQYNIDNTEIKTGIHLCSNLRFLWFYQNAINGQKLTCLKANAV